MSVKNSLVIAVGGGDLFNKMDRVIDLEYNF